MSERMRAMITCVSGSPKRALNSSTFGPDSVIMRPANSTPWNRRPSAARPAIVGTTISCMIRLWPSTLMFVVGETVPMPPVFGPWSPSSARLWSWTEAIGTTREPSEKTRNETSSPSRNSSITTLAPGGAELLLRHDPLDDRLRLGLVLDDQRCPCRRRGRPPSPRTGSRRGPSCTKASASSSEPQTS